MNRTLTLILAANCVIVTGVLLAIHEWLHPGTVTSWIAAAAFFTGVTGFLIGYGVGHVHGAREPR